MAIRTKLDWETDKKILKDKASASFQTFDKDAKKKSRLSFVYKDSGIKDELGEAIYDFEKNANDEYLDPITANVAGLIDDISDSINNAKIDMDEIRDFMKEALGDDSSGAKVRSAEDADTIGGFTVGVDVPAGAVFTDTTYSVGDGGLSQKNFTTSLNTKLGAIESSATKNSTDAVLKGRANHTGAQAISTVTGLQTALDSKLSSETTTTLILRNNVLQYTDEAGTAHEISMSNYIDDTNLARITSGSVANTGIATFTRDDDTTFTIDM